MSAVHHQESLNAVYTTRCTISQIYLIKYSTCFEHVRRPSSGASQHCIHAVGIQCSDAPDDGRRTCPKHVEYFIKQI
jgi:hypothetical protein